MTFSMSGQGNGGLFIQATA